MYGIAPVYVVAITVLEFALMPVLFTTTEYEMPLPIYPSLPFFF